MSNKKRYRIRKAKYGEQAGVRNPMKRFMLKAQPGMQQPSQEEMAMMQQDQMQQEQMLEQQAASQAENKLIEFLAQSMQQGMEPQKIVADLLQTGVPPNDIIKGMLKVSLLQSESNGQQVSEEQMAGLQNEVTQLVGSVVQQMQAAQSSEPQMSKGGFKKKLLKQAKEGRAVQTETPGSILPQPATLNQFIEGVKNEGNEFYAKQMSDQAFSEPDKFRRGGRANNRKLARLYSKKEPYNRSDRRSLRKGLNSGEFTLSDLNASVLANDRLFDENPNYNAIGRDFRTMSNDYLNSIMPQIFSHRNTDKEFSREGTGLENSDVDIYFKKKGLGRREWGISGLDYTSLPAFGGNLRSNVDGSGYNSRGTYSTTTRVIPDATVLEGIREINNDALPPDPSDENVNDENVNDENVNDVNNDLDSNSGLEKFVYDDGTEVFYDPNAENFQGVESSEEDLEEASEMGLKEALEHLQSQGAKSVNSGDGNLYYDSNLKRQVKASEPGYNYMPEEAYEEFINNNMEGTLLHRENNFVPNEGWDYIENKSYADYIDGLRDDIEGLSGEYTDKNRYVGISDAAYHNKYKYVIDQYDNASPEEKARLEEMFQRARAIDAEENPDRKFVTQEGADDEGSVDLNKPDDNSSDVSNMSLAEQIIAAGEESQARGEKSFQLSRGDAPGEMPEENEKMVEEYEAKQKEAARRAAEPLNKWKRENKDTLDYIYNSFHTATGSDLAKYARDFSSYADMIKMFREHTEAQNVMEYQYMVEKYDNASAAEKAELEKKFKRAKELPVKNETRKKEESSAAKKKAFSEEAAVEYFKARNKDFVRNPSKFKVKKVGDGVYTLDGVDGGSFGRYNARENMAFGGSVNPELYKYVYGGDEMDPDQFKDVTDPYFAPGGAFKKPEKPKIDPVLGPGKISEDIQKYRETVYPTSKGIFGQVKDFYKEGLKPLTQGKGIRGVANTIVDLYAPKQFTWLSKKGDKNSAYGYIGVDGLPNTVTRSYENAIYDNDGTRIIGANTDVGYKKKPLRKGTLTLTDSPTKVNRDQKTGEIIDTEYKGFYDEFTGDDSGYLNFNEEVEEGENRLGGLNKFVMAGEIDTDFMQDQNAPNENMVENISEEEEEFNLDDCTQAELQEVGSDCYNAATRSEDYKVNTARTTNNPLWSYSGQVGANALNTISGSKDNLGRSIYNFNKLTSDSKSKQVSYDVGQGWDAVTGYQSMVDSQFNEPVRVSSARPRGMNQTAARGGQYAIGGVYNLTQEQINDIYAAGGSVEIIE